ncbi:MAG: VOC family protein [Burkholderiales bacterium]|nr:VOC family protein [Burkholderiales bacterium]
MTSDRFDHLFFTPRDLNASRKFYVDVLGWQVLSEWTDNHGKKGLILNGGGVRVMLAERNDEIEMQNPHAPHASTLHLDIHDADKRFVQIPEGDHVVHPPQENRWGSRSFVVRDPDGNLIAFNEMRQKS